VIALSGLDGTNEQLINRGVMLPLGGQSTTTRDPGDS